MLADPAQDAPHADCLLLSTTPPLRRRRNRYTGVQAKVMGIFKKKETIEADPNQNRPWWEVRW
jgi:hypothetical protein